MKKELLSFFIFFFSFNVYCNSTDSIIYIMPDNVEIKLNEYVMDIKQRSPNYQFYFYFSRIDKFSYRIFPANLTEMNKWAYKTNRFILINKNKYPLVFDYDIRFNSYKQEEVGEFENRFDGLIKNSTIIFEGYSITFDWDGTNLKEDWGIYKKTEK